MEYFDAPAEDDNDNILCVIKDVVKKYNNGICEENSVSYYTRRNYNSNGMRYLIRIDSDCICWFDIVNYSKYFFIQSEWVDIKYKKLFEDIVVELSKEMTIFATTIYNNYSHIKTIYKNNFNLLEYFYNPNEHHKIRLYCSKSLEELSEKFDLVSSEMDSYTLYREVNWALTHTNDLQCSNNFSMVKNGFPNCCGIDCVIIEGDADYTDVAEKVVDMKDSLHYKGAILVFLNGKLYSINVLRRNG